MKVLVMAAHPDDEVLGCGATAAGLVQEKHEVHFAILGEGITSRHAHSSDADARQLAELLPLGARSLILHKPPHNRLDTLPFLEVVKVVEEMDPILPEIVYTHHPGDLNVDHGVVHRAVLTATRPMAACPVREIYAFEVPSSTEWAFGSLQPAFRPNVFVDVAATLATRVAAMACYETETRAFPHPRSPEALRAAAQGWGSVVGRPAAEAFELVRSLRGKDSTA